MKPQNLHHRSIGDLKSMPLIYRKQALFEWMIEPIVEMELKRGNVYPLSEGQSAQGFEKAVKELTDCLHNQAFDDFGAWPSVSGIELEIKLSEHSSTKAYLKRQSDQTIRNLERIKRRIVHAPSDRALAEVLGTFGADPPQEFSQRQEAVYFLLLDPRQERPEFLKDIAATPEKDKASDGMDKEAGVLDLKECPFKTEKLTTIHHLKFFNFIYAKKPTIEELISFLKEIQGKKNIDRFNVRDLKNAVNAKLTDCEIGYNKADKVYEVQHV